MSLVRVTNLGPHPVVVRAMAFDGDPGTVTDADGTEWVTSTIEAGVSRNAMIDQHHHVEVVQR